MVVGIVARIHAENDVAAVRVGEICAAGFAIARHTLRAGAGRNINASPRKPEFLQQFFSSSPGRITHASSLWMQARLVPSGPERSAGAHGHASKSRQSVIVSYWLHRASWHRTSSGVARKGGPTERNRTLVVITGTELRDVLDGTDLGNDEIYGLGDWDILKGWGGNDNLYGGNDNDLLWGGNGDDNLYGGTTVSAWKARTETIP